jgi:hypothetical protein
MTVAAMDVAYDETATAFAATVVVLIGGRHWVRFLYAQLSIGIHIGTGTRGFFL